MDQLAEKHTKPFVEHLGDLRRTILRAFALLGIGMLLAWPAAPAILVALKQPLTRVGIDPGTFLQVIGMTAGLTVAIRVIFWGGLVISIPGIVLVAGAFIFPGLTPRERRGVLRGGALAGVLFFLGVAMGYFVTLPVAIRIMFAVNTWLGTACEFVELADYVSFVLRLLIAFGLAFELPVLVLVLGYLGLVTSAQLRDKRRHVIIVLMVIAMFLTPPDPFTLLLMAVPMALLYELCIWLVWSKERGKRQAAG